MVSLYSNMRGTLGTKDKASYSARLTSFCRFLRNNGFRVSTADTLTAARALTVVDTTDRTQVREALRPVLVSSPSENATFRSLFDEFWNQEQDNTDSTPAGARNGSESQSEVDGSMEDLTAEGDDSSAGQMTSSSNQTEFGDDLSEWSIEGGTCRQSDVEEQFHREAVSFIQGENANRHAPSPPVRGGDGDDIRRHVTEIGRTIGALSGYQRRSSPLGQIDLRRSLNVTHQLGLANLPRQQREWSLARVSLFIDVSQSMLENLDRQFLLKFLYECVTQFAAARVFFFDTEVVEVTRHFQTANLQETLNDLERAQTEWGAGTTIGACLSDILESSPFAVDNRTVGVIISDGWDAGDADTLQEVISTLQYRSDRLIWLHPLASQTDFKPTVRGLQTALPYVDEFLPFANVADLKTITEELDET